MKVTIASHFQKFIRNPRSWHSFNAPWCNRCVVIYTIFKELLPKKHSVVNAPTPSITPHGTCFRSLMNAFSSKLLKERYSKTFGGNFLAPPFITQKTALWCSSVKHHTGLFCACYRLESSLLYFWMSPWPLWAWNYLCKGKGFFFVLNNRH